jgi:2-polyprenyl-3-methyl-5-hydroxy-6-metoxy-1,4-benzoquinol methylase
MADWYDVLSRHVNPVFTKEDFKKHKAGVLKDLKRYQKYLPKGATILDAGCGLGTTAVPMSALGYKVTGIDIDKRVLQAAKQNAINFGRDIKIIEGDIFNLNKMFGKNSFDACISSGVLEHFKKGDIRKLMKMQLWIAPLVIASMPVKTERTMKSFGFTEETALNNLSEYGIYRNFWSGKEWVYDVLKGFNLADNFVLPADRLIGRFDMLHVIIKRARE